MDKGGNFIGWLYVDGLNISLGLVEEGYAQVHFSAERSSHFKALSTAEEKAKSEKKRVSISFYRLHSPYGTLSWFNFLFSNRPGPNMKNPKMRRKFWRVSQLRGKSPTRLWS